MSLVKTVATAIGAAALMATAVTATNLRIQTHYAPETVSGKLAAQYMQVPLKKLQMKHLNGLIQNLMRFTKYQVLSLKGR